MKTTTKNLTPITNNFFVFVYGTLMSGLHNHGVMRRAGGMHIEDASIKGFEMFDIHSGGYPALEVSNDEEATIVGELWEVASLEPLDALEGYPALYNRKQVNVYAADGSLRNQLGLGCRRGRPWVYYMDSVWGDRVPVDSGDWRAYRAKPLTPQENPNALHA